ncbi:MAG: L,D-transpeptidase [Nitrospiraceae bacterium]|nr:L,D-transpeptidase [Nitrospiraceae bacterium]
MGLVFSAIPTAVAAEPDTLAPTKGRHSLCAVHHPSDDRIEWNCRRLRNGETLEKLFAARWTDVARFNRVDRRHVYPGREIKVPRRLDELDDFAPLPRHLPAGDPYDKLILIDLAEQYLGAYELGRLRFAFPITAGEPEHETPVGQFRITAADVAHASCLYTIERTDIPYPMRYALRFHVNREGVSYWIHGRDMPGYPASHGCVGLYDETMQRDYYGLPVDPQLDDARRLFEWVMGRVESPRFSMDMPPGPPVVVQGVAPGRTMVPTK